MKGRVPERKGERSSIYWSTFQNDYNSQRRMRPKQEARNYILISHMGSRNQRNRAVFHCLPRHITWELEEKQGNPNTAQHSVMGCWDDKQQPNLLHHNRTLKLYIRDSFHNCRLRSLASHLTVPTKLYKTVKTTNSRFKKLTRATKQTSKYLLERKIVQSVIA